MLPSHVFRRGEFARRVPAGSGEAQKKTAADAGGRFSENDRAPDQITLPLTWTSIRGTFWLSVVRVSLPLTGPLRASGWKVICT